MILISLEAKGSKFVLHAADTYIGAFHALEGATIDEVMLRFHPLLRTWASLGSSGGAREAPPKETRSTFP